MKILVIGAALLAAASAAQAADLPLKAPATAIQPIAPYYTWTGFYIGANVGGAWGSHTTTAVSGGGTTLFSSDTEPSGVIGGGQIGYNFQTGNWVWGVEADIQGSDVRGTTNPTFTALGVPFSATVNEHLDWFGTVRGRLGYAWDRQLFYVTGGWAYGHEDANATAAGGGLSGTRSTSADFRNGWTIGAGWEWAFAEHWSFRAEYLHIDFGSDSALAYTITPGTATVNVSTDHLTADVGRVGVNFKFW